MPSQRATWRHADAASATLGCCVSAAHEPHIHRLSAAFPPQHGHSPSPRMSSVRCSFATAVPRSIATTLQTRACAPPCVTPVILSPSVASNASAGTTPSGPSSSPVWLWQDTLPPTLH